MLLQETKQRSLSTELIRTIWWNDQFDYMEVDALESAGGLLCIWNPNIFHLHHVVGNRNFIILRGWIDSSFHCAIINVYGPSCNSARKVLWEKLINLRSYFSVPWCIGGDFNEVRKAGERHGCLRGDSNMKSFNKFIEDMELVDLPMLGKSTRYGIASFLLYSGLCGK